MKRPISIYLAGSIQKGHEISDSHWKEEDRALLSSYLSSCVISFLNPANRSDNLSDQRSVFGRDMLQVFCSDVVFVDARERRGLGVGAEMMWAKLNKIPVITLAPKNSHYHKDQTSILGVSVKEWVHPFVESLSDAIIETVQEGALYIEKWMSDPLIKIKGLEEIEGAMRYYKKTQFSTDFPMKELFLNHPELNEKVSKILQGGPASSES